MRFTVSLALVSLLFAPNLQAADLSTWSKHKDLTANVKADQATLAAPVGWAFLRSPENHPDVRLSASVTIEETAKQFGFFGSSWSVWPDSSFGDQGYEVGILLRAGESSGYRVQLSHRYQNVALVKYPEGGYLRVVPCKIDKGRKHLLSVWVVGQMIHVNLDGAELIRYRDSLLSLQAGQVGIGTSSGARVLFADVKVEGLASAKMPPMTVHTPQLSVRRWLGGRPWVFDGDEPILLLPTPEANYINNVKLRPGYKPQLSFNSHWDISNQGAYPPGANTNSAVETEGGGTTLTARWTARQNKDQFTTRTVLKVGYDTKRQVYTYDVNSELEVTGKEPFQFRYGYDFEHHTPLDPFRWQYLLVRREGGDTLERRPVYPIDPGPMNDVEASKGLRLWYGRHGEKMLLAPAVEYNISETGKRKLNTAVCAAFYDTGVSFAAETAKPGTRVKVQYRYTGYPAEEAEALFKASKIHESLMLDPEHHYIFADDWPKQSFRQFVAMSETWIYGRRPFMTGHNQRPTYELARNTGEGSGFAMKLPTGGFGLATLPTPADLAAGKWFVKARCKAVNVHGPGGQIEIAVTAPKTAKELARHTHFTGNGTFDWKTVGFVFDIPVQGSGLNLGLRNSGTGEVYFAEVEFGRLKDGEEPPAGVQAHPTAAPRLAAAPAGALADYRMEEGKGLHVFDYAGGMGPLELANVGWTTDSGRPALKFVDNVEGKTEYPRSGNLYRAYLAHPGYAGRDGVPVALAGFHGGGREVKEFTLAAWIKPAEQMGKSTHGGKGDVIGFGARRFILRLVGTKAPYQLSAALNVNDVITAPPKIEANRWVHVALTGAEVDKKWKVKLFVDGKVVQEGESKKFAAPANLPLSVVLGTEIFYFHDAYYRGLIGRTLVFDKALTGEEVEKLAKEGR